MGYKRWREYKGIRKKKKEMRSEADIKEQAYKHQKLFLHQAQFSQTKTFDHELVKFIKSAYIILIVHKVHENFIPVN
jgi:hypothetical protein